MYNNPNNKELTQYEKILVIMFKEHKSGVGIEITSWWRASNFQHERFNLFVGYEASARMSELVKKYTFAFETRMNKRFREIRFKFEDAKEIYKKLPHDLGKHLVREGIIK